MLAIVHFISDCALLGVCFLIAKYRIRPTSGIRKDRIFKPMLGLSSGFKPSSLVATPQLTHHCLVVNFLTAIFAKHF